MALFEEQLGLHVLGLLNIYEVRRSGNMYTELKELAPTELNLGNPDMNPDAKHMIYNINLIYIFK